MYFSENLKTLRKIKNISQEELAERLEVSRQAISKWESGECYPETEKLIKLSELFNYDIDELLNQSITINEDTEKKEYECIYKKFTKGVTLGIILILIGVTLLLIALGINTNKKFITFGIIILLLFITTAVPLFIINGINMESFKTKNKTLLNFYTEEEIEKFNKKFAIRIALGVSIILIGIMFLLASYIIYDTESIMPAAIFMIFITISVPIFVYNGIQKSKYEIELYNKINNKEQTEANELLGKISGVIMILATITFFILSFIFNLWKISWIVFPICGMICGIVAIILNKENR